MVESEDVGVDHQVVREREQLLDGVGFLVDRARRKAVGGDDVVDGKEIIGNGRWKLHSIE